MYLCAPEIVASVKDFDFRHVVTFFNRLSEAQMKTLPSLSIPASRLMTIELTFTEKIRGHREASDPIPLLYRWLNRLDRSDKKGTNIEMRFCVSPETEWQILQTLAQNFAWRVMKAGRIGRKTAEMQKMLDGFIAERDRRQTPL